MAKLDDKTYQLIESYIREELNSSQRAAFENRLAAEPDLARAYKIETDIKDSLEFVEDKRIRERLEKIHGEIVYPKDKIEKKKISKSVWGFLAAAAILVGIIIATFFLFPKNPSTNQLMADFYEKPAFNQTRGNDNSTDIQKAYQSNDFNTTLNLIANSENPILQFYKGIAHLEIGEFQEAENIFTNLQSNTNINDQATWYLALTFLKNNNKEACKRELEKLINDNIPSTTSRKTKALELYEKL